MLRLSELWRIDWYTFMAAAQVWLSGGDPYHTPLGMFAPAGREFPPFLAYPPTALTWMALFVPLGPLSYWLWTALEMGAWWLLIRRREPRHLLLLAWAPMLLHIVIGQCTLAIVLLVWAVFRAPRRGFACGLMLALALTKPQVALFPLGALLWHERKSPLRWHLLGGIVAGTAALALPPTLMNPSIWRWWLDSLRSQNSGILHLAAWQGWGIVPLALAAALWFARERKQRKHQMATDAVSGEAKRASSWPWWCASALFPQGSYYGVLPLMPTMRPSRNYWSLAGLAISALAQLPATPTTLPLALSLQVLSAWFISGGPSLAANGDSPDSRQGDGLAASVV